MKKQTNFNEYEYPRYYGQCNGCMDWINDKEIGNVGCTNENIWDDEGNEIDENALDYQDGIKKCPYRKELNKDE